MPSGIYIRKPMSQAQKIKIGLANKGKKVWITGTHRGSKECTCVICGKIFYKNNFAIEKRGEGKFCSKKCKGLSIKGITPPGFIKNPPNRKKQIGKKGISGEQHYNWQGGKSFEIYPVDWTSRLRVAIRERDKYICKICGEQQGDKAHHVHHINYNKRDCNPANLITLCIKCHMRTNFNREYWLKYFKITIL